MSLYLLQAGQVTAFSSSRKDVGKRSGKLYSAMDSSAQGYSHRLLWNCQCGKVLDKDLAGMAGVLLIVLGAS